MTACVIQLDPKVSPINGYFVFDDERLLLVEPDRLMLGRGRVRENRPLLDVRATKLADNFTLELDSVALEYATESQRISLALANMHMRDNAEGDRSVPDSALHEDLPAVTSPSYDVVWPPPQATWKIRLVFTNGFIALKYVTDLVAFDENDFPDFVAIINKRLSPLGMKLASAVSPEDGQKHWALVNVFSDLASRMATKYTIQDLAFFKRVVTLIAGAEAANFSARDIEAMNESAHIKPHLSKRNAEKLLERFATDHWLVQR
ncbi:Non-structural maintenance of chromosomes element 1 [Phlyctochytrium bullatum]|nr:Non-structural maintenance of chromosomes element 1 [Phlyctochytrium bullatum]